MRKRIREAAINRPGFALAGFFQYFAHKRIQVFGYAEHAYLESLSEEERIKRFRAFFEKRIFIIQRRIIAFRILAQVHTVIESIAAIC